MHFFKKQDAMLHLNSKSLPASATRGNIFRVQVSKRSSTTVLILDPPTQNVISASDRGRRPWGSCKVNIRGNQSYASHKQPWEVQLRTMDRTAPGGSASLPRLHLLSGLILKSKQHQGIRGLRSPNSSCPLPCILPHFSVSLAFCQI